MASWVWIKCFERPNSTLIHFLLSAASLRLYGNGLVGKIPEELGSLTKLTSLELQGNQLSGEIPIALGNLSVLGMFLFNFATCYILGYLAFCAHKIYFQLQRL